jgi:hypothetical protein
MSRQGTRAARFGAVGLLALLAAAGCTCPLHSVQPVADDLAETCSCIALPSRSHVYVFCVQGIDPLDCANLGGVKEYLHELGFRKAWFGYAHHVGHFVKEIRRVRECDPDARIVIVGYAGGLDSGRKLVHAVGDYRIPVDLLVCLSGDLSEASNYCLSNAKRVLTILPCGRKVKGDLQKEDGELFVFPVSSLALPTYRGTLELLARELAALAGSFPAVEEAPQPYHSDTEPTPRPVVVKKDAERDEWDFLKPASADDHPPPQAYPPPPAEKRKAPDADRRASR